MVNEYEILVPKEYEGIRIDKFLFGELNEKSRNYIQNIIEKGNVTINNKIIKSSYKLKINDLVIVKINEAEELNVEGENIPLHIVYEDNDVILINKPQGMVVHPAPGNEKGTLVNALLYHCKDLSGINGILRPGIVHRIDKDTSGIIIVAKNDKAHNSLALQLREHTIKRVYTALIEGVIKEGGTINKPLGRDPKNRLKFAVISNGKNAITHYNVVNNYKRNTLLDCILETGRTHQIRVHLSSIGHPIVGDMVYGFKKQRFNLNGQLLHAKTLGFIHPTKNTYLEFSVPIPDTFQNILNILEHEKIYMG